MFGEQKLWISPVPSGPLALVGGYQIFGERFGQVIGMSSSYSQINPPKTPPCMYGCKNCLLLKLPSLPHLASPFIHHSLRNVFSDWEVQRSSSLMLSLPLRTLSKYSQGLRQLEFKSCLWWFAHLLIVWPYASSPNFSCLLCKIEIMTVFASLA